MIFTHLGLSPDEQRDVFAQVKTGYRARPRVQLLNLAGDHLDDITDFLTDGQVDGDHSQAVARTTNPLTFEDPKRRLPFDTDSPASTALFLDRMLKVFWCMHIDAWSDWVEIPVFTGPLTSMQRDGDQATVTCKDKSVFGMADCWKPLHLHKGMKKTDAIVRILKERCGAFEHELDIPDLDPRLPHHHTLHPQAKPWLVARKIAHGMDRELYYDGAGYCRLRHYPTQTRFSFTGDGHVTTPIQISYTDSVVNAVRVLGAQPKGPKTQVVAEAVADAKHRFSPDRMGRNGVPRFLARFESDSSLKHHAEAQARADRLLAEGLTQSVDVSFDCLPVPFLDLGDMCHVGTDDGDVTFRLKSFSLPLLTGTGQEGTSMTVGYRKRVSRAHPKHQGKRHG